MADSDSKKLTQTGEYDPDTWKGIWADGRHPWHQTSVDPYLQKYIHQLKGEKEHISILVSWCGKSLDLIWLAQQGHTVVGIELSEVGVNQFFQENNLAFSTSDNNGFKVFTTEGLDLTIYCGSMFEFTPNIAGCAFDAVWDHHALGATNPADRNKHIEVLRSVLKPQGRILLSNLEYDLSEHKGPPFSLNTALIKDVFKDRFQVEHLESIDMTNTFVPRKFNLTWANRPIHLIQRLN